MLHAIRHNLSASARLEDVLFAWKVIGHYHYFIEESLVSLWATPESNEEGRTG